MRAFIVIFALLLSGCVTTNSYVPPAKDQKAIAKITNTWLRNGLADWEGYNIETIDEKYVSYLIKGKDGRTFRIAPGIRKLTVQGVYNRSFGGSCPCEAYAELSFTAKAGREYVLKGKVRGIYVDFWVIDKNTKKIVSKKASGEKRRQPQNNYVPIYIPT